MTDIVTDLPATDLSVSLVAPDTVQLRFELGEVVASAAGPLPPGLDASDAGRWLPAEGGRPAGRVSGDGTTFQAVDELVPSPLARLFAGDAAAAGDPSRWSVSVNGETVALDAVSRKTNASDSARTGEFVPDYDLATLDSVFLDLGRTLDDGDRIEITFEGSALPPVAFTLDTDALVSEAVHVNLAGFEPGASKTAYLSSWNGQEAPTRGPGGELVDGAERAQTYAPDTVWRVVDDATGATVLTGTVELDKPAGETDRGVNFARADVWEIDFSALDDPGTYRVAVDGIGTSQPFEVGDDVMDGVHELALRGFYHQRSGIELGEPYTDWERPASFPEGTEIQRTTIRISDTREGYDRDDPDPKPLFADATTGEVLTAVSGGWHDAGDWDRRTQHLEASRRLLELAELEPDFAQGLDANIPESGNALPDIVDEALWGLSIFLDLQDADGGVSGGVQSAGDPLYGEGSWSESQGVYAYAPDPWTTWEFAATAAKAAFVLEAYDPALAETYREAGLRAMEWAEARTGEAELDRPIVLEARNVAAAELYRLTGDGRWNDIYLDTTSYTQALSDIDFTEHQYEAAFTYARTERAGVDAAVAARGVEDLVDETRELTEVYDGTAFGQTYNPFAPYGFGKSFSQPSDAADLYVRLHALTGEARYLELAEQSVQFALGANPLNLSFITGLEGPEGEVRDPEELLVVDADTLGIGPPPGIVAYGTYDANQYAGFYTGVLEPTIFPDARERPVLESFDAYFYNIPATEFTVQQGMVELTYVTGYLAAQGGGAAEPQTPDPAPDPDPDPALDPEPNPEPPPPVTVDLDNGQARNTVDADGRDLVLSGFDVDGGGERTFDALLAAGETFSTDDDFLSLIAMLEAGRDTDASVTGDDLVLAFEDGTTTLLGIVGSGLDRDALDTVLI